MIFVFLSVLSKSASIVSIDFGTEYMKMAQSTVAGEAIIFPNQNGKVMTPSAGALKTREPYQGPIPKEEVSYLNPKFGDQALSILKRNSTLGYQFLPRVIGRTPQENFSTSTVINASALFTMFLKEYIGRSPYADGVVAAVPNHWVRDQHRHVLTALEINNFPFLTMIDDFSALCVLYGTLRHRRYHDKAKHVMFVDVGGTSIKCYSAIFTWSGEYSMATQVTGKWSEKVGGHFLAKEVAEKKNISINKARKYLQTAPTTEITKLLAFTLKDVFKVVHDAVVDAQKEAEIDEVQIIGGASQYKFITQLVKGATGKQILKRDFNANEAIALGAVYAGLNMKEELAYPTTYITKLPTSNITLTCNKTNIYCVKGKDCDDFLTENSTGCEKVVFNALPEDVPIGSSTILGEFRLINNSEIEDEEERKKCIFAFEPRKPDAFLRSVVRCIEENCSVVEFEQLFPSVADELTNQWSIHQRNLRRIAKRMKELKRKILAMMEKLRPVMINDEVMDKAEEGYKGMRENNEQYTYFIENGILDMLDENKLYRVAEDLAIMIATIQDRASKEGFDDPINPPPYPEPEGDATSDL